MRDPDYRALILVLSFINVSFEFDLSFLNSTCSTVLPVSARELGKACPTLGERLRHHIGGRVAASPASKLAEPGRAVVDSVRLEELDIGERPGLLREFRILFKGPGRRRRSASEGPPLPEADIFLDLETGLLLSMLVGKTIPSSDSEVVESELLQS